ncbi:MAG: GNAT family N-acetyltransferase [Burkholderiales bacterium]|nr:GNAT family N-acetyltransferase [Burkholderiales bacterium]
MQYAIVPADTLPAADLHRAFSGAFSDYLIGAFELPLDQFPVFLGRQAVDLALSRAAVRDGAVIAFAFVAQRDDVSAWRLATMGALPAARGSGAAPALMDDFIARARAAGRELAELECFAQNERAIRLYRGRGFTEISPLYGYQGEVPAGGGAGEAVDAGDAWQWLDAVARERGDLPLQVTPASLKALPVHLQARRLGSAQLVFSVNAQGITTINSLVDTDPAQRDAESLVRSLPGQKVAVPQLQRPDVGGEALERIGFERLALYQVMMRLPL